MTAALVIGLVIAGLVLIALEILVIPGLGVIGIAGGLAVTGAGYVAITELAPGYAALTIAAGVLGAGAVLWLGPRSRAGRAMVLEAETTGSAADPSLAGLAGRQGVTLTPLRPSGSAEIDDRVVDVVSDGQYVDAGTRIQVTLVQGSRVVVEPVAQA